MVDPTSYNTIWAVVLGVVENTLASDAGGIGSILGDTSDLTKMVCQEY